VFLSKKSSMSNTSKESIIIRGVGAYLPKRILTNDELAKAVDTSDEWIRTRTGISERRIAAEHESTSDLAVKAAEKAIHNAGIAKEDIDLLIVATMTSDKLCPATATIVQHKLQLRPIPAFDVQAACSGYVYIQEIAASMLKTGNYRNALIIGAEKLSSILDWQDRTTCVLFGDGAGAVVLSKTDQEHVGILHSLIQADGQNADILHIPGGGSDCPASSHTLQNRDHFLKMSGKEVFKFAIRVAEQTILKLLADKGLTPESIDYIIPHQANIRILEVLAERLNLPLSRFICNLDKYGNTSAASIPIALDEALHSKKIEPGSLIVLIAFGGGLTWGGSLIKWHS
jgi:3-oxoacyl-[acyl-carrier-protein] synthase-3